MGIAAGLPDCLDEGGGGGIPAWSDNGGLSRDVESPIHTHSLLPENECPAFSPTPSQATAGAVVLGNTVVRICHADHGKVEATKTKRRQREANANSQPAEYCRSDCARPAFQVALPRTLSPVPCLASLLPATSAFCHWPWISVIVSTAVAAAAAAAAARRLESSLSAMSLAAAAVNQTPASNQPHTMSLLVPLRIWPADDNCLRRRSRIHGLHDPAVRSDFRVLSGRSMGGNLQRTSKARPKARLPLESHLGGTPPAISTLRAREAWERRTSRQRCTAAPAEPGTGQWSLTVVMAAAPARVPNDVAGGDMFRLWSHSPAVVAFSSLKWGS
ncbi:hypothetical protein CMUS01_12278 [Colletotrichum musicola]|uniref:Uncharacterized protein n=1 Tax=Colletotrichum musicola TaxID=2175873 RepID=A0A8H6JNC5_9PEZI|nr:hypothetical protein CMUS01_12278 [Colletotrichum musicola]